MNETPGKHKCLYRVTRYLLEIKRIAAALSCVRIRWNTILDLCKELLNDLTVFSSACMQSCAVDVTANICVIH